MGLKKFSPKFFATFILGVLSLTLTLGTALTGAINNNSSSVLVASAEEDWDLVRWAACFWGRDSAPAAIYRIASTDDVPYTLVYKSAISSGTDDVSFGWNWVLSALGFNFGEVNDAIKTGSSVRVNAFDRFGFAGLKYTSYGGEWRYVNVDTCNPTSPKGAAGKYYPTRLDPTASYSKSDNSDDRRSQVYAYGLGSRWWSAISDQFANSILFLVKIIVLFTIAFTILAFSDIFGLMGLDKFLIGDGTTGSGVIGQLFDGIFFPLVFLMFTITAIGMLTKFFRGQGKQAIFGLLKSLAFFVLAIILYSNAATLVPLPNKITLYTQTMVMQALDTGLAGGKGICDTRVGDKKDSVWNKHPPAQPSSIAGIDSKNIYKDMEGFTKNISSTISCSLWNTFLFTPWSMGQFGTTWDKLWVNGYTPPESQELGNSNGAWVGEASVPMGGGESINNWALFHISTMTNRHIPTQGTLYYTQGTTMDWWRIVDALSNYDEKKIVRINSLTGAKIDGVEIVQNSATSPWPYWIGQEKSSRIGTTMFALFAAIIGSAPVLVVGFTAVFFAFAIAILMAFSPLMFLLACWDGTGRQIFIGWLERLVSAMISRIFVGILFMITLILTIASLQLFESESWFTAMLILAATGFALIKYRQKFLDLVTGISFGGFDLSNSANKITRNAKRAGSAASSLISAGVISGIQSKRYGDSFRGGSWAGVKNAAKNLAYTTELGNKAIWTAQAVKQTKNQDVHRCCSCKATIDTGFAFADLSGNYYCYLCAEVFVDSENHDLEEVYVAPANKEKTPHWSKSFLSGPKIKAFVEQRQGQYGESKNEAIGHIIQQGFIDLQQDFATHREFLAREKEAKTGKYVVPPQIPPALREYLNESVLGAAWRNQDYMFIGECYRQAWILYVEEFLEGAQSDAFVESLVSSSAAKGEAGDKEGIVKTPIIRKKGAKKEKLPLTEKTPPPAPPSG